jgi:Cys-rich protein (TIGR01571 family)
MADILIQALGAVVGDDRETESITHTPLRTPLALIQQNFGVSLSLLSSRAHASAHAAKFLTSFIMIGGPRVHKFYSYNNMSAENWEIGLCEIGNCSSCCYSWCCTGVADSEAKSLVDGSQCIFNYYCVNCVVNRWMIRTAYGIPGDECNDCLVASFCCPCSTNQLYQTAYKRGNPVKFNGGNHNNEGTWQAPNSCTMSNCCYATWCPCCATGTTMNKAMGT